MNLAELQRAFQARVLHGTREIEPLVLDTSDLDARSRLAIYESAFPARLCEALAVTYPALRRMLGEHDFSAFRSSECQARSPVRTLHSLEVEKHSQTLHFVVRANAFLHHMVRNLVGTLVYVGKGKHPPEWVREVLESRNRAKAAPTFGPEGLVLETIEYEAKWGLPL